MTRPSSLESAVVRQAREHPQRGQSRVAAELGRLGYRISSSGVRYLWRKHGLETTYKRLKVVEREAAAGGRDLTAAQKALLSRGEITRRFARESGHAAAGRDRLAADARRRQILLGAADLFVRHGYSGTSIRDIARRTGLLPGSVYHHFPAKEDLFTEVHREGFRQLIARAREIVRSEPDPWRRLERICTAHIEAATGDNPIHLITATGLFAIHEEQLRGRLQQDREAYETIFRQVVSDLRLPRGIDPSLFRVLLLGALNWSHLWYRKGRKTPQEIARTLVTLFRGKWAA